jgi:hypothetical protein
MSTEAELLKPPRRHRPPHRMPQVRCTPFTASGTPPLEPHSSGETPDLFSGTGRAKATQLRPYRQGELDGLCGLYAGINAVRLALRNGDTRLGIDDWQALFTAMLAAAEDRTGAYAATAFGIGTKSLVAMLKVARQHLSDEHGIALTVRRVGRRGERLPFEAMLARLIELAAAPHSAVILSLCGHLDHWSVLKRVTATSLELFDSYGFIRVAIANCRMSHEPARPSQREHVLHARALLHLTAGA